jgi:hypothetical protein
VERRESYTRKWREKLLVLLTVRHSLALNVPRQCPLVFKNFPAFYGTLKFITMFTRALHRSLSYARSIQPIPPHPISLRSILILSSHLCLGLLSDLFLCGFYTKILHAFLFSPMRATWPVHLIILDFIIIIIFEREKRVFITKTNRLKLFMQIICLNSLWGSHETQTHSAGRMQNASTHALDVERSASRRIIHR